MSTIIMPPLSRGYERRIEPIPPPRTEDELRAQWRRIRRSKATYRGWEKRWQRLAREKQTKTG